MFPEDQYALRAIKAGASGYLTKETPAEELIEAIKILSLGKRYISSQVSSILAEAVSRNSEQMPHEVLSDREFQVFIALAFGKKIRDISEELSIGVKTVHTYRARILSKLKMKSNSDIVTYALRYNLLS